MKFHITIIDNETGKKLLDRDTNAIIAGVSLTSGSAMSAAHTCCSAPELLTAVASARKAADQVLEKEPRKLRKLADRAYRFIKKTNKKRGGE